MKFIAFSKLFEAIKNCFFGHRLQPKTFDWDTWITVIDNFSKNQFTFAGGVTCINNIRNIFNVVFADDVDAVAANALPLAYGDFKQAYTIIDQPGLDIIRDPYTLKGFVLVDTTKYTGGAVTNFEAFKIQKIAA